MRVGYGYNRHPGDFAHLDLDKLWIDMPGSGRCERGDMLRDGGVRPGDEFFLLAEGELGSKHAAEAILSQGASIHVVPPPRERRPPGAPAKFTPTPEQDAAIKALWLNPGYTLRYVLDRAQDIMGGEVRRHQLIHRYGNRHKRDEA